MTYPFRKPGRTARAVPHHTLNKKGPEKAPSRPIRSITRISRKSNQGRGFCRIVRKTRKSLPTFAPRLPSLTRPWPRCGQWRPPNESPHHSAGKPRGRPGGTPATRKAAVGDGVTHLARRALKSYLEDHSQDLTNEHKIYIEDYLKDNIGSKSLEVGEEITFSEDLIKEAIDASLKLTPEQLQNLEQYSVLVAW